MSIDDFAHMWNGADTGWKLHFFERTEWQITFLFGLNGPTLKEVSALRNLLDDFRDLPAADVWSHLKGNSSHKLPRMLSNLEMRWLTEKAAQLNLAVSADCIDRSGYLPVHSDGSAMIIEDDSIAEEVARRMIRAGVPIEEVHID